VIGAPLSDAGTATVLGPRASSGVPAEKMTRNEAVFGSNRQMSTASTGRACPGSVEGADREPASESAMTSVIG
jgi:hypothetical protein